jgi:RNA polymerase sigma factor (sigma-70 family)
VTELASGAREEFAGLVELHHADLMRLTYGMCGDRDLADDAVQAAWQMAWRALPTLRDPERVRNWLITIAANEVRRQLRRRRLRTLLEPMWRSQSYEAQTTDPQHLDLASALRRLSERDRRLLAMRYAIGLNSEEIGGQLGLSPSGVRVRLQRLLIRLREELSDE